MKLLLDTHIFIWWADQPERLSPDALSALEDEANELLLSVASVWEMQIKIQLGKLKLSLPLKELVKNQQETNDLTVSPVALPHVLALDALPFHHKDPFDRLLIAQSIAEGLTIVTADSQFSAYSVTCCSDQRNGQFCAPFLWLLFKLKARHFHLDIRAGVGIAHAVQGDVYRQGLVGCELGLSTGNYHDGALFHRLSIIVDNSAAYLESGQSLSG